MTYAKVVINVLKLRDQYFACRCHERRSIRTCMLSMPAFMPGFTGMLRYIRVSNQTVKAWPIDPLALRDLKLEVSEKLPQG